MKQNRVEKRVIMGAALIVSSSSSSSSFLLCSLRDLNFLTRAEPMSTVVEIQSLTHWTAREFLRYSFFFFILNFLFGIWVLPINNAVILGEQRRDSAIHIHVSILPQTPLPSRLPHNIEQSSLCYPVGPC